LVEPESPHVLTKSQPVKVDCVFMFSVDCDAGPLFPPHRPVVNEVWVLPSTSLSKKKPEHVTALVPSNLATAARFAAVRPDCVPAKYERVITVDPEFWPTIPPTIDVDVSVTVRSLRKYESVTRVAAPAIPLTELTPRAPVTDPTWKTRFT
jgi:hypothetical protein